MTATELVRMEASGEDESEPNRGGHGLGICLEIQRMRVFGPGVNGEMLAS